MAVELKTVGLLRRSCFVLPEGKCLNLIKVFESLHESELSNACHFDEGFRRIVIKQTGFTITCFSSGKVMVCGLAPNKEVKAFLELVWKDFFNKRFEKV